MTLRAVRGPAGSNPPPEWLTIVRHTVDDTLVLFVSGDIDVQSAPALHEALTVGPPGATLCIIDLTTVTFLDAAGLAVLLDATCHALPPHEPRLVVNGNSLVIRPIEITGLDDSLRLYHSLDEALHSGEHL